MLHLMLSQSTGGIVPDSEYTRVRTALLADEAIRSLVPRFVRACRDPSAFWSFIKNKYSGPGSYEARREFLRTEFEPLLSALERFEASPVDELVVESVDALGSASVTAAWTKALHRLACESRRCMSRSEHAKAGHRCGGPGEHCRMSGVAGGLPGRRDGMGRREEPPRDESGFRAHGSNQRFHRLQRQAVLRAQTSAPSLADVCPAAAPDSRSSWVAAQAAREAVL